MDRIPFPPIPPLVVPEYGLWTHPSIEAVEYPLDNQSKEYSMKLTTAFLKRHSLIIGILLMFLLTWPIDLAHAGVLPIQVPFGVYILLGWGFIVASLIMTGLTVGKTGVISLLKRYVIWRVNWKWYLVAFFLVPTLSFLAILINAVYTKTPIDFSTVLAYEIFGPSANLLLLIVPFFLFDAIANGEEMGWRGYVLPRLQTKHNALAASLILAVIWALWHLPKFVTHWDTVTFLWFTVDVIAKSILLTWMLNNTRGSLLLVTLFHASFNTSGVLLPIANNLTDANVNMRAIIGIIEIITAVVVVFYAGPERLSRTEAMPIQEQLSTQTDPVPQSISAPL
jgi:membrane protease YdiL (CAAX protease family)